MYARSWLESVKGAGITNYVIGAMDPQTSVALPSLVPASQCFNAPFHGVSVKGEIQCRAQDLHTNNEGNFQKGAAEQKVNVLGMTPC